MSPNDPLIGWSNRPKQAELEGNNGVAFVIATDLMPKGGMLYVEMAEELR